jgi:hypothetical protein
MAAAASALQRNTRHRAHGKRQSLMLNRWDAEIAHLALCL